MAHFQQISIYDYINKYESLKCQKKENKKMQFDVK